MRIEVDDSQVRALAARLSRAEHEAKATIERQFKYGMQIIQHDLEDAIKGEAPVRTGYLRDHVEVTVETSDMEATLHAGDSAPYAPYVELGTRYMDANPFIDRGIHDVQPALGRAMSRFAEDAVAALVNEIKGHGIHEEHLP